MRKPPCRTDLPLVLAAVLVLAAALATADAAAGFCDLDYICGDGILVPQCEQCDDGNLMSGDGCDAFCRLENGSVCGNGVLEDGEECDIYDLGSASCADVGCSTGTVRCYGTCLLDYSACAGCDPVCGNGVVEDGEECDDGNLVNGDGCDADCLLESECGNGVLEDGEECDRTELGGASCADVACSAGAVSCFASCLLDYSGCSDCVVCADDVCEAGEDCHNCATDCPSFPGAFCGSGLCEAGEGENCVNCPEDCNGKQSGRPGDRFCCGDGGGDNPITCPGAGRPDDSRCTEGGWDCTVVPMGTGVTCCGDADCQSPEDGFNCPLDCGPPLPCVPAGERCLVDQDCCSGECNHGGNCK